MANDYLAYINRYPDLQAAYGQDAAAGKWHYENHGQREGRDASISGTDSNKDSSFDIDRFEGLLNRLEASKGRQQRQKSVEERRDIFSQGLAGMMSNF
jgi:hypothetical protein